MAKKAANDKNKKNGKKLSANSFANRPQKTKRAKPDISPLRLQDPMLAREQKNYDNPLPSREYILYIMKQHGKPITPSGLAIFFGIQPEEQEAFSCRLAAMTRDAQLMLNRKGLLIVSEEAGLIDGYVTGHRDGFGFFIPNDGSEELFVPERDMRTVLPGDHVLIRKTVDPYRKRTMAKIVEITKRVNQTIVGRLYCERKVWFLIPEDPAMPQMIVSPKTIEKTKKWKNDLFVLAAIIEQPTLRTSALVKVMDVLGDADQKNIEIEVSIHRYGLPHLFPKPAKKLAIERAVEPALEDCAHRTDLRTFDFVTIDGETAKDFDDAVYCEPHQKGYRLMVAIADVSHYVHPDDPLDTEALNRGNSVYFPSHVIPMLPESLSNDVCSLNPKVDRLVMVCDMLFNPAGERLAYQFYPGIISSKARLTYHQVFDCLYQKRSVAQIDNKILPMLESLKTLYDSLHQARKERGSIDFEIPETQIVFGDDGKIESIVPLMRNEAHRIIEECMLAANVCAAELLENRHELAIFRDHLPPKEEKLTELKNQLKAFGLTLEGDKEPQPKDFAKVLEQIQQHPTLNWMQMLLLRSLQQANYAPTNTGHFALAYPAYTHFTSPIRRYPDLIVHRLIKDILAQTQNANLSAVKIKTISQHCSMTERRADNATRDAVSWLKCDYMADKIGMTFTGTISSITGFGAFVMLDDLYVEGLIHVTELGKDYFEFDQDRCRLTGQRSGFDYRIGDRVTVQVANVNIDRRQIDFVLTQFPGVIRETEEPVFFPENLPENLPKESLEPTPLAPLVKAKKPGFKKSGSRRPRR